MFTKIKALYNDHSYIPKTRQKRPGHLLLFPWFLLSWASQTMWINSSVVARHNVPITFIHIEATLI